MGYDVLLSITDVCNARCVMCNIWLNKDTGKSFLPVEYLDSVTNVESVSIAGGEPFLHKEIVELVRRIHDRNPSAKIIFSTNGFSTERIVGEVQKILAFHPLTQVTISLDGVGEMHDRIRGIPGAFDKVNRTFDRLGEIGLTRRNFAFTITGTNYADLPRVFAHARAKGAGLSLAVAQSSKFLNVELPLMDYELVYPYVNPVLEAHLRSRWPMDWARAFFLYGILRYLATGGRRPLGCDAFDHQFMVDQTGTVSSCHPLLMKAGTLAERPLFDILNDPATQAMRPGIRACHACWEVCTARSAIRANRWRVGAWIVWNKALAHARIRNGRGASVLFPETRANGRPAATATHPAGDPPREAASGGSHP